MPYGFLFLSAKMIFTCLSQENNKIIFLPQKGSLVTFNFNFRKQKVTELKQNIFRGVAVHKAQMHFLNWLKQERKCWQDKLL